LAVGCFFSGLRIAKQNLKEDRKLDLIGAPLIIFSGEVYRDGSEKDI